MCEPCAASLEHGSSWMLCHIAGPMKSWTLYGSKKEEEKPLTRWFSVVGLGKMKAAAVLYICSKTSYWAKP